MFEKVEMAPADPILGLSEAFAKDSRAGKINLSVGVYKDERGKTPILGSVKEAEKRILLEESSKSYRPIDGAAEYAKVVQSLLFGDTHEIVASRRAVTAHTPGGTGALRVAADYLKKLHSQVTVWVSDPTWANHPSIFQAAGLAVKTYPYFDAASNSLAFDKMLVGLDQIPTGDVVLLHACCHNPTGVDPTVAQWKQIAEVVQKRGLLPLVDFAYQGFGEGLAEDAEGLLQLCRSGCELMICSSFSKNFGLYNERVGALTVVAASEEAAQRVLSQVKTVIRANYSNPPAHGGSIVTTVLNDRSLREKWEVEVKQMRDRINGVRKLFVDTLSKKLNGRDVKGDYSFIMRQRGMFSFSGLSKEQVKKLLDQHAIYMVSSGRINVAGMTADNMEQLCDAIVGVL